MSGLVKPKEYDWKDSNMALFGSDTEKKVKKESAESEPAWEGSGKEPGVEVWRINKFKVERVPQEEVGEFFNGDSYIVLNTYKDPDSDALLYDVHFWIGKKSTQDEYGTAAYKTVELDTYHDDKPIQHREVQGHETSLFKSYFENYTILKGGHATGFRRYVPEAPKHRLLHFKGTTPRDMEMKEIPMKKGNLNDDDCFIVDLGDHIWLYNGKNCDKDEKFCAGQYMEKMKSDRFGKAKTHRVEGPCSDDHPVMGALKEGKSKDKGPTPENVKGIIRVGTDPDNGAIIMDTVLEGSLDRELVKEDDVFICDTGSEVFVYVGGEASVDERKNGLPYASKYLMDKNNPLAPITVVSAGQKCPAFDAIW